MNGKKIIYSLCTEDINNVASQESGRELTADELRSVADKLGGYMQGSKTF